MKSLAWKDFWINVPVLAAGCVVCFLPYVVATMIAWADMWPHFPERPELAKLLWNASAPGRMATLIVTVLLGANAIAAERSDRSAEFLFGLPPSRLRILTSKFLVALAIVTAVWLSQQLIVSGICPWLNGGRAFDDMPGLRISILLSVNFALFGAAWLASSFMTSPAYAAISGGGLVAAIIAAYSIASDRWGWPPDGEPRTLWLNGICLGLGTATFLTGSGYYLRRIEP